MTIISFDELSRRNGKNGRRAWVAFEGFVYDVTDSFLWKNGEHQVLHHAGSDLTEEIAEAPHSGDLFAGFPVVGKLAKP